MNRDEMLLIYDGNLNELGSELRSKIHRDGLLHQVVHCWIIGEEDNEKWIYFQQRAYEKKDFPGLYDISAAGHIGIGEDADTAVKRETHEEIGIIINPESLKYIGTIQEKMQIDNFNNNEICEVYLYLMENQKFNLGPEVEKMIKVTLGEFEKLTLNNSKEMEALSIESKYKFMINKDEFCAHEKEYLKYVIKCIENL
jgi:isopentenyldiphosphate isomerase